ncbi:MAG: LPS assembly lipoprotein LptE, partial [Neisseria sp.]|nr:LPS assembly lipoprotein LptE [Neisseria sp.]
AKGRPSESTAAQAVLVVEDVSTQRDVQTVTRAALINEYALVLNLRAQAYRNGKPLGDVMNVQVRRTMDYADSEVLGKQEEEAQIWREMRRDAAEQLVRRLAFLKAQ